MRKGVAVSLLSPESVGGDVPLAARENDGQRRGTAGWLWEQKSQSRGTVFWGIKNRGR